MNTVKIVKPRGSSVLVKHIPTGNLSRLTNYSLDMSPEDYASKRLSVDAADLEIIDDMDQFQEEYIKMKTDRIEAEMGQI